PYVFLSVRPQVAVVCQISALAILTYLSFVYGPPSPPLLGRWPLDFLSCFNHALFRLIFPSSIPYSHKRIPTTGR
ncbi:unnamed protein product, partial [Amoebophrya sp. A25]